MANVWWEATPSRLSNDRWVPDVHIYELFDNDHTEIRKGSGSADLIFSTEKDARAWSAEMGRKIVEDRASRG